MRPFTNLCVIAAKFLSDEFNIPGLKIRLEKRLPIGAGLGGGSSDAAAVIQGGLQLYGITYSADRLLKKAIRIGADVPFFLLGGAAYGSGKGEKLHSIRIEQNYHILLVLPDIQISTEWAYKNLNLTLTRKNDDHKFRGFRFHNLHLGNFRSEFRNDFEDLIFEHYPNLAFLKTELYDQGAIFASLSGSGSSLYGLYGSQSLAEKACEFLSNRFRCQLCRPVVNR